MIFTFIKYTHPSWQFNIRPWSFCFPSAYTNNLDEMNGFIDNRYETESARIADAGFRLWNKGVLLQTNKDTEDQLESLSKPSLHDEYIFIRKYWGFVWATFALLLRLLSFKNPFKEIKEYLGTRHIEKVNAFNDPVQYEYESFYSQLIEEAPLVAVIIPTLNRYTYLKDVLHDLEKQSYKNFEVIVVDQSTQIKTDFYEGFDLSIRLVCMFDRKLWTARNKAVMVTDAEYLLFFDDDSRVGEDWIAHHLKCLDFFKADISAGVSLAKAGMKIPENYSYFRWADQFDSGNAMVKREVFKKIGLFDEQFNGLRMGDGEFGYRAYRNGLRSISNHKASRIHLKVASGGLREMGSWDGFRPKKWFAPKPVPSVIYLYQKYLSPALYRNALLMGIMLSNVPYKYKRSSRMLMLSVLLTILKSPVLAIQYYRAKQFAKKMIERDKGFVLLEK